MNARSEMGTWISPDVAIAFDKKKKKAFVHDPVTYGFNGKKPMLAEVKVDNSKRITFGWTVKSTTSSQGQLALQMKYTATYLKKNGRFVITATPIAYPNSFRGDGKCKVSER